MTAQIIGIAGRAGSGKDTLAHLLCSHLRQAQHMAFADPVKTAVAEAFGFDYATVFSAEFKTAHYEQWGLTGREILQRFGTEAMRNTFGQDFWVKRLMSQAQQRMARGTTIVVSDVRFENEAEAIRSAGGALIHLYRPNTEPIAESGHVSEATLSGHVTDYLIENVGTQEDLAGAAQAFVRGILPAQAKTGADL